jgi:HAE1 family hydrophobic/amphiphilic exporter-1
MNLVKLATERRVTIAMVTLAVLVFGFVSVSRLKVNLLPNLAYPTITIRTELPSAAPQEVENLVTKPVEDAVGVIKNVRQIRSVSRSGQSDVTLEFRWGTDMDYAAVDVREKLDTLTLPLDAKRPLLLRFDPSSEPIMRYGVLYQPARDAKSPIPSAEDQLKFLRRYGDEELTKDLESTEGVAAVKVSGGLEDEVQVLVDQNRLDQLNIPIATVVNRLKAENVNLSGGRLEEGHQRLLVRTINEFKSLDDMENTIVAIRDGHPVHLRDVAQVKQGYKERQAIIRVNGQEAVELALYKEGDANTVTVARRIKARMDQIRKSVPGTVKLVKEYDQSTFIAQSIDDVVNSAIFGGLLAALVIYFFLRNFWATAIISISIPVSVIATFNVMYLDDITLNIMSLGGIALAVGMLVDNSIVVLENIARHRGMGKSVLEAARDGTSEVGTAIVASTLTTVAVFFPMVFVQGIAGQLFGDQALTVTFALLFSLLVAITLIPMLSALGAGKGETGFEPAQRRRLPGFNHVSRWLWLPYLPVWLVGTAISWCLFGLLFVIARGGQLLSRVMRAVLGIPVRAFQAGFARLEGLYSRVLGWSLEHKGSVLGLALGAFLMSLAALPMLGVELIPQLSQGEFYADVKLPPGSSVRATANTLRDVQASAANIPGVASTYSVAGTGNRLDANPVDAGENTGRLNVVMNQGSGRAAETAAIERLRATLQKMPGVEYKFGRPELFSFKTPLEVEVSGYDLDQLQSVSNTIVSRMQSSRRFTDIKNTMEGGNPEIRIRFDHDKAAQLGLEVSDIANRVVRKVRGDVATRYSLQDRKIDILVRNKEDQRASVEDIRNLIVNPESDRPVPLSAVANVSLATGPSEVHRIAQSRVAVISADLAYGDLGAAAEAMRTILKATPMPPGVTARITGQNEDMQTSFQSMKFALGLAIFLVYLVMASQFESLVHPFVILFTIPLALVGAVAALLVTNSSISVVVFIGLIMLAGIVVNNAIVLIDLVNQLRERGTELRESIMEAGRARLRPIVMTTLTTVLGLLPMALGIGEGAEIRAPMAITVIGGLLVSTMLTLVVIPVVYTLVSRHIPLAEPGGVAAEERS